MARPRIHPDNAAKTRASRERKALRNSPDLLRNPVTKPTQRVTKLPPVDSIAVELIKGGELLKTEFYSSSPDGYHMAFHLAYAKVRDGFIDCVRIVEFNDKAGDLSVVVLSISAEMVREY